MPYFDLQTFSNPRNTHSVFYFQGSIQDIVEKSLQSNTDRYSEEGVEVRRRCHRLIKTSGSFKVASLRYPFHGLLSPVKLIGVMSFFSIHNPSCMFVGQKRVLR